MSNLDDVIKRTVLDAIVQNDFNMDAAATSLAIARRTIFYMMKRWNLATPLNGGRESQVKWRDYSARCDAIRQALNSL